MDSTSLSVDFPQNEVIPNMTPIKEWISTPVHSESMCVLILCANTAVLLNPFLTFLSFSENTSQVAAILVCYSPVDGEIGSKHFAMSETPIMVLNNCWK